METQIHKKWKNHFLIDSCASFLISELFKDIISQLHNGYSEFTRNSNLNSIEK